MQAGPLVFHSLLHGSIFLPLSRHPLNAIKMPLAECRNGNCYATGTATKTAVTYATVRNPYKMDFQFVSTYIPLVNQLYNLWYIGRIVVDT